MLVQFTCESDNSLWYCDTDRLRYARTSRPITDIVEAEERDDGAIEEYGKLVSASPIVEVYTMEGRNLKTEAPGAALCSIALVARVTDKDLLIGYNVNVPVKDFACISPINNVRYELMGVKH